MRQRHPLRYRILLQRLHLSATRYPHHPCPSNYHSLCPYPHHLPRPHRNPNPSVPGGLHRLPNRRAAKHLPNADLDPPLGKLASSGVIMRQDRLQPAELHLASDAPPADYTVHTCPRNTRRSCNCAGDTCADDVIDTPSLITSYNFAASADPAHTAPCSNTPSAA